MSSKANNSSSKSNTSCSLCLQSRNGRKVISLALEASTKTLYERASKEFAVPVETLKVGFPPKRIPCSDSEQLSSFVVSSQERIQVEFSAAQKTKTAAAASIKATKTSPNGVRRSKREASKAATEAMPAIIKAQEDFLKSQKPTKPKRGHGSPKSLVSRPPAKKRKESTSFAAFSEGRRLADGAVVNRKASRKSQQKQDASKDVSFALMDALHNKGKMGTILRKGMKNAVQASYETTRAFSRLAAIQARSYTLQQGPSEDLLMVTFHGSVDKAVVHETVECIPLDVLRAVLEGIYASDKEALRPENLSRLSPRVLWSCVHYHPSLRNLPDMYRELFPDQDWTFLRRRAQQLSAKALENKRQQEEANDESLDQGFQAAEAVEHAMEHLHEYHEQERKARQAHAAEARLRRFLPQQDWKLTTPSEPDRDELRQCIESSGTHHSAAVITQWISQLMKDHKIHNWRELANISSQEQMISLSKALIVPKETLEAWVDFAQNESVSEIIVEICDGNVHAVEVLQEYARSGTPKDLGGWRSVPDLLLERLPNEEQPHKDMGWRNLGTISVWCQRAYEVLQIYEWLNWYCTPIDRNS